MVGDIRGDINVINRTLVQISLVLGVRRVAMALVSARDFALCHLFSRLLTGREVST